jgi:hypothetical protein
VTQHLEKDLRGSDGVLGPRLPQSIIESTNFTGTFADLKARKVRWCIWLLQEMRTKNEILVIM